MDDKDDGKNNGRKTKAQLQEELDKTQEILNEYETRLAEYQKERQQVEAEIERLKEKLQEYESEKVRLDQSEENIPEQSEEAVSEDIAAPKATFRIDLYPRQGHYQGRIEHLLTKQKKPFTNLDQDIIMDFISSHLPQAEAVHVEEPEPAVVQPAEQAPSAEEHVEEPEPLSEAMAGLAINVPGKIVPHDQPFQVQLTLDLTNVAEHDIPLGYKASIYVKPLIGARQIVGEFDDTITSAEVVSIDTKARISQVGTYRLEAALTSSLAEGKPAPYTAFVENGLLQVY